MIIKNNGTFLVKVEDSDLRNKAFKIPSSVTVIMCEAFSDTSIQSLVVPANVRTIGESAFRDCIFLEKVVFQRSGKNGIAGISNRAFYGCTKLKEVVLSDTLMFLGDEVFLDCKNLEIIKNLPKKIITGRDCFKGVSEQLRNYISKINKDGFEQSNQKGLNKNFQVTTKVTPLDK